MRRINGKAKNRSGSFIEHKILSALEFAQYGDFQIGKKALVPLGGFTRSMNPATAIDADLDMLVLEGIPTVNFGRGVPDPTPRSSTVTQPLNRRLRREIRANMGTPSRISRVSNDYLRNTSFSDGPFGSMSSLMRNGYPRSPYANTIPYEKSAEWMNTVKTRVDSVLGEQPKTMKELLGRLKAAEEFVNSSAESGRNFTIKPVYFLSQTQSELAQALGGRFAGPSTVPSQHDLGLYYVLADHLLSYPEAFDNTNLIVLPMNMPDTPVSNGTGGAALSIPSYFSPKISGGRRERRINLGVAEVEMLSESGVRDFSDQPEMHIDPKTSGAQIQSLLMFPVYGDPRSRAARFSGGGQTIEISATEGRLDSIKNILEKFENSADDEYPLVDTVSMNIMLGFMDRMRELEAEKNYFIRSATPNAAAAIQAIDAEIKRLLDEAELASSASIATHEFGHYLDKVGDYKMSRAYQAATSQSSRGLNSSLEYQRDVAELMRLKNGESSEILDDVAYALSQDWTKKTLSNMLTSVAISEMASETAEELASLIDALSDVTNEVRHFARDGGDVLTAWYVPMSVGARTTLQDSLRAINASNVVKMSPSSDPEQLTIMAKDAIRRMSELSPTGSVISRHPYLAGYSRLLAHMTKLDNFDKLAESASPVAKAQIYVAAAEGMRRQITQTLQGLASSYEAILENSERQVDRMQPIVSWINDQTIDMNGYRQGWRNLITDLVSGNRNAVEEFMQLSSDLFRKDAWVNNDGTFSNRRYLMDVLAGVDEQGGTAKGFGGQISALFAINRAFNMRDNNGWKNLPDDQISLIQSATNGISEYAGPADYSLEAPKPKMQLASNAETYAELHAALSMDIQEALDRLDDDELEAVTRLREEMIRVARGMIERMGDGGIYGNA